MKHLFEQKNWCSKGSMLRRDWKNQKNFTTYLPSTVDRALRSAEADKQIAVKYEGKNTLYKWIPHEMRERYIPTAQRENNKLFRL